MDRTQKVFVNIIIGIAVTLVLVGLGYWLYAAKTVTPQQAQQSQAPSITAMPTAPPLSANSAIDSALQKVATAQSVASLDMFDCSKVSGDQFIGLGDAIMGTLTGDETHHSTMEKMMGGETGDATNAAHTNLGKLYLNCAGAMTANIEASPMASSMAMNDTMKKTDMMPSTSAMPGSMAMGDMDVLAIKRSPALGEYLADMHGRTLYTFINDNPGVSNCTTLCLAAWPAYVVPLQASKDLAIYYRDLSVVHRPEGSLQLAWKGMPLYYFAQDKNPGDAIGDGVKNVWHVATVQ